MPVVRSMWYRHGPNYPWVVDYPKIRVVDFIEYNQVVYQTPEGDNWVGLLTAVMKGQGEYLWERKLAEPL